MKTPRVQSIVGVFATLGQYSDIIALSIQKQSGWTASARTSAFHCHGSLICAASLVAAGPYRLHSVNRTPESELCHDMPKVTSTRAVKTTNLKVRSSQTVKLQRNN